MPSISEPYSHALPFGGAPYGVRHGAPARGPSSVGVQADPNTTLLNLGDGTAGKLGGKRGSNEPPPVDQGGAAGLQGELGAIDPRQISTDISTFIAVFAQFAQKMRAAARLQRNADLQLQVSSLQSAADEIRKAAADRFKGSITQAAMQMGGGLLQMGLGTRNLAEGVKVENSGLLEGNNVAGEPGIDPASRLETADAFEPDGFSSLETDYALDFDSPSYLASSDSGDLDSAVSFDAPKRTTTDATPGADTPKDAKAEAASIDADVPSANDLAVKRAYARANDYNTIAQGSSGILGAVGGFVASPFTQKADEADAAKAGLEAQARVHEQGVQQDDAEMQQAMDIIRDIREKLGAIEQAQIQANQTIARNL